MSRSRDRGTKATCRVDTRGGSFAGIPKCLIDSPAYRGLSLYSRALLVELIVRMNGFNNGKIAMSHRDARIALGSGPNQVAAAFRQLVQHAIIDVELHGSRRQERAAEYRLTFASTESKPATNDYLHWTPSLNPQADNLITTAAVAPNPPSAIGAVAPTPSGAIGAVAPTPIHRTETPSAGAIGAVAHISKPYPVPLSGSKTPTSIPLLAAASRSASVTHRDCEDCGAGFSLAGTRGRPKRFCSERCRKRTEVRNAKSRARAGTVSGEGVV